jgi:pimeloyl-ACP methyl ester carboxylesterase
MRLHAHKLVAVIVTVAVTSGGCQNPYGVDSSSPAEFMRRAERSALDGDQLSPFTQLVLEQRDLATQNKRRPGEVIAQLYEEFRSTKSRKLAVAVSELCFARAKLAKRRSPEAVDAAMSAAVLAYAALFSDELGSPVSAFDQRFHMACGIYNQALGIAVMGLRGKSMRWGDPVSIDTLCGSVRLAYGHNDLAWGSNARGFDGALPTYEFAVRGLKDHLRTSGLGVPLVLTRRVPPQEEWTAQDHFLPRSDNEDFRQVFPATLIMRFSGPVGADPFGDSEIVANLEVYDPTQHQSIEIDGHHVGLETDTTTPLAYALESAPLPKPIRGLLDADAWAKRRGLYMMMPYQPGKIPVVFVHGLASSPLTWLPMINNLLGDEKVRARYQIWYFLYPTGNPIVYNASAMRQSLVEARQHFNPDGTDPAFDRMVLVGHSMGGLLSRLNISSSGDRLWEAMFETPLKNAQIDDASRTLLEKMMYFEPLPFVDRVIFMAVPHRGSKLAQLGIVKMFGGMLKFPADLVGAMASGHLLRPRRELGGGSLKALDPDNPLLHALDNVPLNPQVRLHSIIADHDAPGNTHGSDLIVPYESSHLPQAESELIIHGTHACTAEPLAIREVRRILLQHAETVPEE